MVMGPILVQLSVPPPVSAATTATTLLILSSSTGLVYMCRRMAPVDYSAYLSFITMCGAFTGKVVVGRWVRRTGKESVIVWCLAAITVSSVVVMGCLGFFKVIDSTKWSFRNVCDLRRETHVTEAPSTQSSSLGVGAFEIFKSLHM